MDVISTTGFERSANLQVSHLAGQARPRLKGHGNSTRVIPLLRDCELGQILITKSVFALNRNSHQRNQRLVQSSFNVREPQSGEMKIESKVCARRTLARANRTVARVAGRRSIKTRFNR